MQATQPMLGMLTGGFKPQFWGRRGRMRSEMVPLSSPGMTSYKLTIVTIGLPLTVFAVLRMFQTDRRTVLV